MSRDKCFYAVYKKWWFFVYLSDKISIQISITKSAVFLHQTKWQVWDLRHHACRRRSRLSRLSRLLPRSTTSVRSVRFRRSRWRCTSKRSVVRLRPSVRCLRSRQKWWFTEQVLLRTGWYIKWRQSMPSRCAIRHLSRERSCLKKWMEVHFIHLL